MKGIKKITALISVAVLAVSLAACGASGNQDVGGTDIGSVDTGSAEAGSGDAENTGTDSTGTDSTGTDAESQRNILVAYFSYTGNTEEVAKQIAEQTGGDRVQIERSVPYDDVQTEGEDELESDARPEITVDLESIDGYDTIFVGPIWWDEAPMVIAEGLTANDDADIGPWLEGLGVTAAQ